MKFKNYVFCSSIAALLILLSIENANFSLGELLVYFGLFFLALGLSFITYPNEKNNIAWKQKK